MAKMPSNIEKFFSHTVKRSPVGESKETVLLPSLEPEPEPVEKSSIIDKFFNRVSITPQKKVTQKPITLGPETPSGFKVDLKPKTTEQPQRRLTGLVEEEPRKTVAPTKQIKLGPETPSGFKVKLPEKQTAKNVDAELSEYNLPSSAELSKRNLNPDFFAKHPTIGKILLSIPSDVISKWEKNTTLGKFESRAGERAAGVAVGKQGETPSTGNKVLDFVADLIGTGIGFSAPSGIGGTTFNIASRASNLPQTANVLSKLPDKIQPLVKTALRGATAGAVYGGSQAAVQGGDIKDIARSAGTEAAYFAAADVVMSILAPPIIKAVDDTLKKVKAPETVKGIKLRYEAFKNRNVRDLAPLETTVIRNTTDFAKQGYQEVIPKSGIWAKYDSTGREIERVYETVFQNGQQVPLYKLKLYKGEKPNIPATGATTPTTEVTPAPPAAVTSASVSGALPKPVTEKPVIAAGPTKTPEVIALGTQTAVKPQVTPIKPVATEPSPITSTQAKPEQTVYRYYLTQRPPSPGAQPKGAINVVSFDEKQYIDDIGREAWGYVEYDKPIENPNEWELTPDKKTQADIEWENIQKQVEEDSKLKKELINKLKNVQTFKAENPENKDLYAIVSPSAKEKGKYQITYFDKKGPLSDSARDSIDEVVNELVDDGYKNITPYKEPQPPNKVLGDLGKQETATEPVNRLKANVADLAADYKARGLDKYQAWDQLLIDKNLKPGIDAKEFYKIFEQVTPALLTPKATIKKTESITIKPDFAEYARAGQKVEIRVQQENGEYEWEPGTIVKELTTSSGNKMYEVKLEGDKYSIRVNPEDIRVPKTPEGAKKEETRKEGISPSEIIPFDALPTSGLKKGEFQIKIRNAATNEITTKPVQGLIYKHLAIENGKKEPTYIPLGATIGLSPVNLEYAKRAARFLADMTEHVSQNPNEFKEYLSSEKPEILSLARKIAAGLPRGINTAEYIRTIFSQGEAELYNEYINRAGIKERLERKTEKPENKPVQARQILNKNVHAVNIEGGDKYIGTGYWIIERKYAPKSLIDLYDKNKNSGRAIKIENVQKTINRAKDYVLVDVKNVFDENTAILRNDSKNVIMAIDKKFYDYFSRYGTEFGLKESENLITMVKNDEVIGVIAPKKLTDDMKQKIAEIKAQEEYKKVLGDLGKTKIGAEPAKTTATQEPSDLRHDYFNKLSEPPQKITYTLRHYASDPEYIMEITGTDPKYKYKGQFLNPVSKNWSSSGKTGDSFYELEEGKTYKVKTPYKGVSYKKVENGKVVDIGEDEVKAALKESATPEVQAFIPKTPSQPTQAQKILGNIGAQKGEPIKSYDKVNKLIDENYNDVKQNLEEKEKRLGFVAGPLQQKQQAGKKHKIIDVLNATKKEDISLKNKIIDAYNKVKDGIADIFEFEHTLRGYPKLQNDIRLFLDAPRDALDDATKAVLGIVGNLTDEEYSVFRKLVILKDLIETGEQKMALPENITLREVKAYHRLLEQKATPEVKRALNKHKELMDAVGADLVSRGKMDSIRENYYPHHVLGIEPDFNYIGTPSKIKKPFRRYTKERVGSVRDIDTNYIDVMTNHLTRVMLDNAIDDFAMKVASEYDILPNLSNTDKQNLFGTKMKPKLYRIYNVKGKEYIGWQYQPGNVIYPVTGLTEEQLLDAFANGMELDDLFDETQKFLALGGKRKIHLLPVEIAQRLDKFRRPREMNKLFEMAIQGTRLWKKAVLDFAGIPYHMNNLIGDLINLYREDPGAFKKLYAAYKALKGNPKYSKIMEEAKEQRITESGLHEINMPISKLDKNMAYLFKKSLGLEGNIFNKFVNTLDKIGYYRENIPRLAKFMADYERILKGQNVVAKSIDIKGLPLIEAAGKVSREFTVDYRKVTTRIRNIRDFIMPFATFYIENTRNWGKYIARHPLEFLIKFGLPMIAMYAWNNTVKKDVEDKLPDYYANMPHLNTGYVTEDGKPIIIAFQTPVELAGQWAGLDITPDLIAKIVKGEITPEEAFKKQLEYTASAPVKNTFQLTNPVIKTLVEIMRNQNTFYGKKIVPERLQGTPEAKKIQLQYAIENIVSPYGQYMKAARAPEPGQAFQNYLLKTPLNVKKALGYREVDVKSAEISRIYDLFEEQDIKYKQYKNELEKSFVKACLTNDEEQFKKDIAELQNKGLLVTGKMIQDLATNPRVLIRVINEKLKQKDLSDEQRQKLLNISEKLKQEELKEKYKMLPKSAKTGVLDNIFNKQ